MTVSKTISFCALLGCVALPALAAADPQGTPPPPAVTPQPPTPTDGAPPTEYKSDATKAWGETDEPDAGTPAEPAPPPAAKPTGAPAAPTPADAEREALKKKCTEGTPEVKNSAECKAVELDVVFQGGMGTGAAPAPAVPQAADAESKGLVEKKMEIDERAMLIKDGHLDLWAVARREAPLLEESPSGFFSIGARVGYPFMIARGSGLDAGYEPLVHASIEGAYQPFRFLQIALVADFDALRGDSAYQKEYLPANVQYSVGTGDLSRPIRDVGTVLDDFIGLGVRPTIRLSGEWRSFQASLGLGVGWHFIHTSGRWRTKLGAGDRANDDPIYGGADWSGNDYAIYSFVENDNGAYSAFELALMYRLLGGRLGAGLLLQYTVLMHGKADPDVEVEQQYGLDDTLNNPAGWDGYTAEQDDYEETLVRHLGAMNFLTIGLAADYRF